MELHLFFDSMEFIFSGFISFKWQALWKSFFNLTFNKGNPSKDNLPKSHKIGLRSWKTKKNTTQQQSKYILFKKI